MTNTQIEKSERIGILIYHFFNGRIRQKEWKELNAWRNLSARNERAFQDAIDLQKLRDSLSRVHEAEQILLEKMKQNPGPWASTTKAKQPLVYRMMRTAAAAVILLGSTFYFTFIHEGPKKAHNREAGFISGNTKHWFTSDLKRGWYTGLAGITLETGKKGEMIYVAGLNAKKSKSLFYGLIAPSGRTLSLKLPGGIQILLNTESTIQYPANFTNDSIHLIIDGEAFIEVPDSIRKFFQVVVNGMNIQTNGADFNVLAYKADSFVAVTPLKGNLEISSSNRLPLTVNRQSSTANRQLPINLTPGQQAVIRKDNFELIQNVDTSDAVAWKNEMFSFHQVDIETIMHTISRWYGKDVKYEGAIPDRKYDLVLPRGSSVIQLWHLLNQQGVNFTEDGDYFIIRFPGN